MAHSTHMTLFLYIDNFGQILDPHLECLILSQFMKTKCNNKNYLLGYKIIHYVPKLSTVSTIIPTAEDLPIHVRSVLLRSQVKVIADESCFHDVVWLAICQANSVHSTLYMQPMNQTVSE